MSSSPGNGISTGTVSTACAPRGIKSTAIPMCRGSRSDMARVRTMTEKLALTMLARDGIAAIWQLHLASAEADRSGYPRAAASISEIAEAAEEAWMRAEAACVAIWPLCKIED